MSASRPSAGSHLTDSVGSSTEEDAITAIESGKARFWTRGGGQYALVQVSTRFDRKYLKTVPDGI